MKRILVIAWFLGPFALSLSSAVQVRADDDSLDADKYRALQKQAESKMRETANEVRKDSEAQIKELEGRLAEVKKWTNVQFELGERGVIDKPKAMASLLERWQIQRDNEFYRLLQFPEQSGGAIESGRALNVLVERVGAAALQNNDMRKIKPDSALPLTATGDSTAVSRELAEEITWQENTVGAKLVGQGNRGPLDLDWPRVLLDDRWSEQRRRCDEAIRKSKEEIVSPAGLSEKTEAELREAVASLNREFADYRGEWCRAEHPGVDRGQEYLRIIAGTNHIKKLVMGIYQLTAISRYQLGSRELFYGGTIEDYLAFMQRNNLRFAAASPAHRSAYYRVFTMMVRYYLDQKMAVRLEQQLDKELADVKQTNKEATDVALGRVMSASDQAAIQILDLKTIHDLLK